MLQNAKHRGLQVRYSDKIKETERVQAWLSQLNCCLDVDFRIRLVSSCFPGHFHGECRCVRLPCRLTGLPRHVKPILLQVHYIYLPQHGFSGADVGLHCVASALELAQRQAIPPAIEASDIARHHRRQHGDKPHLLALFAGRAF
jgi:hypothetical protein